MGFELIAGEMGDAILGLIAGGAVIAMVAAVYWFVTAF